MSRLRSSVPAKLVPPAVVGRNFRHMLAFSSIVFGSLKAERAQPPAAIAEHTARIWQQRRSPMVVTRKALRHEVNRGGSFPKQPALLQSNLPALLAGGAHERRSPIQRW